MSDDTITVGVLYPPEWYRDDDGFRASLDRIAAVDPRITVIAECYVEPQERGGRRGHDEREQQSSNRLRWPEQRPPIVKRDVAIDRISKPVPEDALCDDRRSIRDRQQDQNLEQCGEMHETRLP